MKQYDEMQDRIAITHVAKEIRKEWKKVSPYAQPYLNAMCMDSYGRDSYVHVVLYFLSNASGYRGGNAKAHKSALKAIIAGR